MKLPKQPIIARSSHGSPQHPCFLEDALQEPSSLNLSSLRLPLPKSSVTVIVSNQYDSVTAAECHILAKVACIPDDIEEGLHIGSLRITEYITGPITGSDETVEEALQRAWKHVKMSV